MKILSNYSFKKQNAKASLDHTDLSNIFCTVIISQQHVYCGAFIITASCFNYLKEVSLNASVYVIAMQYLQILSKSSKNS